MVAVEQLLTVLQPAALHHWPVYVIVHVHLAARMQVQRVPIRAQVLPAKVHDGAFMAQGCIQRGHK